MEPMEYSYRWLEDPTVFAVNRRDAHSDHYFATRAGLMQSDLEWSLNGQWELSVFENPELPEVAAFCLGHATPQRTVQVPGHLQLQGVWTPQYVNVQYPWDGKLNTQIGDPIPDHSLAFYRKSFTLPQNWQGKEVSVVFHGADCAIYVFCNGNFVGYGEDSATPSEFHLTPWLDFAGENTLSVQLFRRSSASWLEDQDFWRLSGLYRDVTLVARPECHLEDLFLHPSLNEDYTKGDLTVEYRCTGEAKGYAVTAKLLAPDGAEVGKGGSCAWDGRFAIPVENPALWSGEFPNLYTLELWVIREKDNAVVEYCRTKTGFRRLELIRGAYHINGKKLQLRGVNRHEFCLEHGRAVPEEVMLQDIFCLKRNNINAVRTSHYPNQSAWYRLCDEYGIYLIDEVNLETHGSWSQVDHLSPQWNLPGNREEWKDAVVDRARSMVERDKNHPSIVIWSCGNESFAGTGLEAISDFLRRRDPSRPVHYEGVNFYRDFQYISDFESHMYAKAAEVREYLENNPAKPYLLCEYAHAMHNSCGGLDEYGKLEQYPGYQGGFIWDFVDQCLLDEDGNFAYGGDFGDRPTDYDFCCNGILFADRTESPKMQEVKQVYSPVRITVARNRVAVENRRLFANLSDLKLICTAVQQGKEIFHQEFNLTAGPGETEVIPLIFPEAGEEDLLYSAVAVLAQDTPWAEAGYPMTFGEKLAEGSRRTTFQRAEPMEIIEGGWNVGVKWENGSVLFSLAEGGIVSLTRNGKELIALPPRPCYWRASTSNDIGWKFPQDSGIWAAADLLGRPIEHSYDIDPDRTMLTVRYRFHAPSLPRLDVAVSYTVNSKGEILVSAQYNGISGQPLLPEFGLRFALNKDLEYFSYFGRGPEENYCDRNTGAALGWYQTTVQDCLTPYAKCQECGNRTEVRSFTLTDETGVGLSVQRLGEDTLEVSCLPVSAFELENARHPSELPQQHYTHLKVLAAQMGVGGDDSWGAPVLPRYRLSSQQDYAVRFILQTIG